MEGSLVSMVCRMTLGDENPNFKLAREEFEETGRVRIRMKAHLYGDNVSHWHFIYVKTGNVAWITLA